jgi:hypothetical protein
MLRRTLPQLPKFSWTWTRAFAVGLFVCSALSAAFAGLHSSSPETALVGALYPLLITAVFALPVFLVIWLAPPLNSVVAIPTGAICCALPPIITSALSAFPQWSHALTPIGSCGLAGVVGGLAFHAFSAAGRTKPLARIVFFASIAVIFLPVAAWLMAWRVPDVRFGAAAGRSWETADSGECKLMARAIHEMKSDQLPNQPPLMSEDKAGGQCNWRALGMPLQRVTRNEFQDAAGPTLTGRYIEHIGISPPRYSLLHLHALVEVSHSYGPLGGDGFYCSFGRGFSSWQFMSCTRAWIS